jgi:hypothetical protein
MSTNLKPGSNLSILLALSSLQNDPGPFDYPLRHRAASPV